MSDNNNSIGVIVVGILGFMAIVITGKWLLDRNNNMQHQHRPFMERRECGPEGCPIPQRQERPARPIIIQGGQEYPHYYPNYHNQAAFWTGYGDGWSGGPARSVSPDYVQGYQIGVYDRRLNQHYYYDHYCPPGFQLSIPGLRINIR